MNVDQFSLYHTRHSDDYNTCGKYLLRREIFLQDRRKNSICYYIHELKKKFREYWSLRFLVANMVWKTDEQ